MRRIFMLCVTVCATGCDLYFGPAQDAAPPSMVMSDAGASPDAAIAPITPPDPPATCSKLQVYVQLEPNDPRGPFLTALIKDALAFYRVPITTTPSTTNLELTIALSPHASTAVQVPVSCMLQLGGTATIADDSSRSNEQIVANALHGLGVLYSFPPMVNPGDCMYDPVVRGCTFGRAQTVASDPCGYWQFGPVDEAQMLANDLGCPGVGP